jgi:hypothetical protein
VMTNAAYVFASTICNGVFGKGASLHWQERVGSVPVCAFWMEWQVWVSTE